MNRILFITIVTIFSIIQFNSVQSGVPCTGSDTLENCISLDGIALDPDDACYEESQKCDGTRDCAFGDDEWNCNLESGTECTKENGYFECMESPRNNYETTSDTTNICIREKYACDGDDEYEYWAADCPEQEDITITYCEAYNDTLRSPCTDDDDALNFLFTACLSNDACIPTFWLCNGENDCADNSDEFNSTCQGNTTEPTSNPTFNPTTSEPTNEPTNEPSDEPTDEPTNEPTVEPSPVPTVLVDTTSEPTNEPTRPSCWWTNYRGGSSDRSGGGGGCPTPKPTRGNPTPRPTNEPTRPSDWWTNYRGGSGSRDARS